MEPRKPSKDEILSSCDEVGPEDGVDPRKPLRRPQRQRVNRKALQLCEQIARTLGSVLAYESGDDLLQDVVVESVEPFPNSGRVLVTVSSPAPADEVLEHLARASSRLRSEVAAEIHRKRVSELIFRVRGDGEPRS